MGRGELKMRILFEMDGTHGGTYCILQRRGGWIRMRMWETWALQAGEYYSKRTSPLVSPLLLHLSAQGRIFTKTQPTNKYKPFLINKTSFKITAHYEVYFFPFCSASDKLTWTPLLSGMKFRKFVTILISSGESIRNELPLLYTQYTSDMQYGGHVLPVHGLYKQKLFWRHIFPMWGN